MRTVLNAAETWLLSLLKYFRDAQDDLPVTVKCDILLTGGEESVFDEEATSLGARLFYVPFTRRKLLPFVREFRRILACGKYHAIHDHQDYIAGLHFLMSFGNLPPVQVAHVHNPLYHRLEYANGPVRRLSKSAGKVLLGHLATHVMGTSRQIVAEYGFDQSSFSGLAPCYGSPRQDGGDHQAEGTEHGAERELKRRGAAFTPYPHEAIPRTASPILVNR